MELSLFYSQYLAPTMTFLFSESVGPKKLVDFDYTPSDREVLKAISYFVVDPMFGAEYRTFVDSYPQRVAVSPSLQSKYMTIDDSPTAIEKVTEFIALNYQFYRIGMDIYEAIKDFHDQYANQITDELTNSILAAPSDTQNLTITFSANSKYLARKFAELYANGYLTCTIPVIGGEVVFTWNNYVNSVSPISANLVDKGVLSSDTLLQYNVQQYIDSEPVYLNTRTRYALSSDANSCLNLYMLRNKITNRYIPMMCYLFAYEYGSNITYPLKISPEKLVLNIEDQGGEYGVFYKLSYMGSMYDLFYENYDGPALTNPRIGVLSFSRLNTNNGLSTIDVSLPYTKIEGFTSYLEPMGLVPPTIYVEELYPSSTVYEGIIGRSIDALTRSANSLFFGQMTDNDIIDYSNYEVFPYIYNNISKAENYEFPINVDPNLKQKLIDETYDLIGSGNSVDAGDRINEGLTEVLNPSSIGSLVDVFPITDVMAEAINVYPVDTALDETIAANPADVISIADAAVAIETGNQNSGASIGIPPVQLVSATGNYGLFTLYKVTTEQLKALSNKLWSSDFLDNFHPFKNNPSEALISLMAYPMDVNSEGSDTNIVCGNYDCSPASGKIISNLFNTKTLGSVQIPERFNSFLDYSPFTTISLFLPFIGFVDLDTDEVMGATISVFYRVELITGTCVACVKVVKGTMDAILYQFSGNMGITLPMSGSDFSRVYSTMATSALTAIGVITGQSGVGAGLHALGDVLSVKPTTHKTGNLSGNSGMCGNLAAYVVINSVVPDVPDGFSALKGKPTNKYLTIGNLSGFVKLDSYYLNIPNLTDKEKIELDTILKEGFFI